MVNTFNESAIATYLKTSGEEWCEKLGAGDLDEVGRAKIEGRIDAIRGMLERFELGEFECEHIKRKL
ncbi:hypothetical protein GKZ89_11105 [Bacillus mangrovi]|uniref:Uncharacterized protein n=1 Tax=Metabacillus mangrovi TaxID=1491830 RepID=A0A7X2V5A3_9BACI|nr:hypothetical protein [Metabacillus mangrovi]MTH53954.1 hypothetical protein [Metabacillus mangrovi]